MNLLLSIWLSVSAAWAGDLSSRLQSTDAVVWLGLDFSASKFFVPETFDNEEERTYFAPQAGLDEAIKRYKKPDDAWNDLTVDWNTIAQNSLVGKLEDAIQRDVTIDLPTPSGQTKKSPPYFLSQYEYKNVPEDLDRDKIAAMVKKYRVKERTGIAFVVVVDRASAIEKTECAWPTWFDIAKHEIVATDHVCEKPSGTTFREQWSKPLVAIVSDQIKAIKKGEL